MPTPWSTTRRVILYCWLILVAVIVFYPPATGTTWRTQRFTPKVENGMKVKPHTTAFGIELLAVSGIAALGLVIFSPGEDQEAPPKKG
ncbi:MAG: hypothetical protein P8K80_02675 [Phycisphaerales bacterium]|nr:hypothetical protein [Phycisphaerales bacterium]